MACWRYLFVAGMFLSGMPQGVAAADKPKALTQAEKESLQEKLDKAQSVFLEKKDAVKTKALACFDAEITKTNGLKGLTPAARADRKARWTDARGTFREWGKFPTDDEFALIELQYYLAIDDAFRLFSKASDEVIHRGNRAEDQEIVAAGLNMKRALEEKWLGESKLEARTKWAGTFTRYGKTIPYELTIRDVEDGGSFKGHVEDNNGVQGNWSYDVEGQRTGIVVEYRMTTLTEGKFTAVQARGIVSGDRLIAEVRQTVAKGKVHSGTLILKRGG